MKHCGASRKRRSIRSRRTDRNDSLTRNVQFVATADHHQIVTSMASVCVLIRLPTVSGRKKMFARATFVAFASAMTLCMGLAPAAAQGTPDYAALIAAPDRSANDRATDARRDPLKLLALIGARPGMKVLDIGAGGGYSTELMARAVGPNGIVYGQNPPTMGERGKATFEARTKTPAGKPM